MHRKQGQVTVEMLPLHAEFVGKDTRPCHWDKVLGAQDS